MATSPHSAHTQARREAQWEFARVVWAYRERLNWTQEGLSLKAGLSPNTLLSIESPGRHLTIRRRTYLKLRDTFETYWDRLPEDALPRYDAAFARYARLAAVERAAQNELTQTRGIDRVDNPPSGLVQSKRMPAEQSTSQIQAGLREEFVTDVLRARADQAPGEQRGEGPSSYVLKLGRPEHPVWLRVYPESRGVRLDTDWTQVVVEGITRIRRRGDRLQLESVQRSERTTIELRSNGQFSVRRAPVPASPETSRRSQR